MKLTQTNKAKSPFSTLLPPENQTGSISAVFSPFPDTQIYPGSVFISSFLITAWDDTKQADSGHQNLPMIDYSSESSVPYAETNGNRLAYCLKTDPSSGSLAPIALRHCLSAVLPIIKLNSSVKRFATLTIYCILFTK